MNSSEQSKAIQLTAKVLDITWYVTIAFFAIIIFVLIFRPEMRPESWIMAGVVMDSSSTPYSIVSQATGLPLDFHGVEAKLPVMNAYGHAMIKSPGTLWSVLFNIKEGIAQIWVFVGLFLLRRAFRALNQATVSRSVIAAMFRQVGVLTIFFELANTTLTLLLQIWLSKHVTTTGLRIDKAIFPELAILFGGLLLLAIADLIEQQAPVPEKVPNDPSLTN
ncbi:MAG: hypothetical protein IPP40_17410 [bacterium]|nr:hypothetical protein [bacterium]